MGAEPTSGVLSPEEAKAFAVEHVRVWNGRNLEQILALYSDDIELTSPLAARMAGGGGVIKGKAALRQYFQVALEKYPDLHFELLDTLVCTHSVTLYYVSIEKRRVAEVMFFDAQRKIEKVFAHYAV